MFCTSVSQGLFFTLVINNLLFINATPFTQSDLNDESLVLEILRENSGLEHRIIQRQAEDGTTTTKQPEPTTKPPEMKSEKQQAPPTGPLELDPDSDSESVTPNNTTPKLPDIPNLPGFPPLSPPGLFPPSFYPGPFQPPRMPPPEFDPCSNPWAMEPMPEEGKKSKQDKIIAKMQCDFMMMQQKFAQFYKTIGNELTELKKLNYNTVARLARLESLLRNAGPPPF